MAFDSPQLLLNLEQPSVSVGLGDLLGPDALRARLMTVANGRQGQYWLHGETGVGKSLALRATTQEALRFGLSSVYLPLGGLIGALASVEHSPFADLESIDVLCLDDVDVALGSLQAEEALFHLLNRCLAAGNALLMSAQISNASVGTLVPDLQSRLRGAERLSIEAMDDAQLHALMSVTAKKIGVHWTQRFSDYLLRHRRRQAASLIADVKTVAQHAQAQRIGVNSRLLRVVFTQVGHDAEAQRDAGQND